MTTTRVAHTAKHNDHAPPGPRLRLQTTLSPHTLLDGGWWPRSSDPVTELPGLIRALDARVRPSRHLILTSIGWNSRPHRLHTPSRQIRLDWRFPTRRTTDRHLRQEQACGSPRRTAAHPQGHRRGGNDYGSRPHQRRPCTTCPSRPDVPTTTEHHRNVRKHLGRRGGPPPKG